MKKRRKEPALDYTAEVRRLKEQGPDRLYLLWGEEEYLRDSYLETLRNLCFPDGDDDFQHRIFRTPQPDARELRAAVDTAPFFSDRVLIELREVDFGKSQEDIIGALEDIPAYCTVVFLLGQNEEPNGKSRLVKVLREQGTEIRFTVQSQDKLVRWIARRFSAHGKGLQMEAAQRLIFLSGDHMKALIPEIDKIAHYASGDTVTVEDVNAVANRIAETDVFELTDAIAERRFNNAAGILADLLSQRDVSVPAILSLLSGQFRRLYLARQCRDVRMCMEYTGLKYDFLARKLMASARNYDEALLIRAVSLCAEADYRLKSSGADEKQLLKETVMRVILNG